MALIRSCLSKKSCLWYHHHGLLYTLWGVFFLPFHCCFLLSSYLLIYSCFLRRRKFLVGCFYNWFFKINFKKNTCRKVFVTMKAYQLPTQERRLFACSYIVIKIAISYILYRFGLLVNSVTNNNEFSIGLTIFAGISQKREWQMNILSYSNMLTITTFANYFQTHKFY